MRFTKMEGLGNDFILINGMKETLPEDLSAFSKTICDRHFGVGADGVLLVLPSDIADIRMVILNSDGSEAQMCGNGIRCFAMYVYEKGILGKSAFAVETRAGIIRPELKFDGEIVAKVRVDLGMPRTKPKEIPVEIEGEDALAYRLVLDGKEWELNCVSMGNPHCVLFVPDAAALVHTLGPVLECHPIFPEHTNVEFVEFIDRNTVKMRVYERGCGETLACGTGGAAVTVAAVKLGITDRNVTVRLLGGDLEYEYREDGHIWMTGPAKRVAEGCYNYEKRKV